MSYLIKVPIQNLGSVHLYTKSKGRVILELALKYLCYVLLRFLGPLRQEFRIIKLKDANTFLKEETLSRLIRCMFNKEFENQRQNITRFISGNFKIPMDEIKKSRD